jgi:regulation of enolase protein 1 (concanavalin A-like superfamily)
MVQFRDQVQGAATTNIYQNETVYGFAREGKGYFITNVSLDKSIDVEVDTSLPDGEYTNLFDDQVYQIQNGKLQVSLPALGAIALVVN